MSVAIMNPQQPTDAEQKSRLASVPAWGSYLYQNFLLPAFSPTTSMSEWLNLNTPFAALTPRGSQPQQQTQQPDYFGSGWKENNKANTMPFAQNDFGGYSFAPSAPMQQSASYPTASRSNEAGPSNYYPQFYSQPSISTSLLVNDPANYSAPLPPTLPFHRPSVDQPHSRNSINMVDVQLTHSPSPMNTHTHSPRMSPKRAAKRRCDSLDESEDHEHDHLSEHEPDVPEGVERDGMIWGMKVEAYRALSARERKRVRNRISARTFRAKRKEHLSSLEENINIKDLKLRLATEEANRLKQEVADLKRRLAKYE